MYVAFYAVRHLLGCSVCSFASMKEFYLVIVIAQNGTVSAGIPYRNFFLYLNYITALTNI